MAKRPAKSRKRARKATAPKTPPGGGQPTRLADAPRRDGVHSVPADFHAMYDSGFLTARGVAPAAAPRARGLAPIRRAALRGAGDADIHVDDATQLPNLVILKTPAAPRAAARRGGARARGLAAAVPSTPASAAVDFIASRRDLWQLSAEDAATLEVVSVSEPARPCARGGRRAGARGWPPRRRASTCSKLKTVNLIQRVDGVEVFNSDTTAASNANNEVIAIVRPLLPRRRGSRRRARGPAPRHARRGSPSLTPAEDAIARAAFDLTNVAYKAARFLRGRRSRPDSGPYRFYDYAAAAGDRASAVRAPRRASRT